MGIKKNNLIYEVNYFLLRWESWSISNIFWLELHTSLLVQQSFLYLIWTFCFVFHFQIHLFFSSYIFFVFFLFIFIFYSNGYFFGLKHPTTKCFPSNSQFFFLNWSLNKLFVWLNDFSLKFTTSLIFSILFLSWTEKKLIVWIERCYP